ARAVRLRGSHRPRPRAAGRVLRDAGRHQRAAVARGARRPGGPAMSRRRAAVTEPPGVRAALTALAVAFLALFLALPLVAAFVRALERGGAAYRAAVPQAEPRAPIRLTLLTAAIAVPANVLFGLAAAWTIAKFEFRGRDTLLTLIDLPFAVSPVIAGMVF